MTVTPTRVLAVLAAGLGLVSAMAVAAPPAAAADRTYTTSCDGPLTVRSDPDEWIVVTMTAACASATAPNTPAWFLWNINGPWSGGNPSTYPPAGFLEYVGSEAATYGTGPAGQWYVRTDSTNTPLVWFTLAATDGASNPLTPGTTVGMIHGQPSTGVYVNYPIVWAGPATGAGGTSTPPPSWYQSVGRPSADATCAEHWHPSWEQWANEGSGGYVCSTEEYWDDATTAWAFRSR